MPWADIAAVLTLLMIVCAVLALKNPYWMPLHRAWYSLDAATLVTVP